MAYGVDFMMFALGVSALMISAGYAFKLIASSFERDSSKKEPEQPQPKWAPVELGSDLNQQLSQFQTARFASPIVQRVLSEDAGPPPRRPYRPVSRPPAPPVQPPQDDKVVRFPVKMKKEPPKEGA